MALERIHTTEMSTGSDYILVNDTTPLSDYTSNGISDPIADIELAQYILKDEYGVILNTRDVTSHMTELRTSGYKVYIEDLFDGIHNSELILTYSSTEYPSYTKDCYYSSIKNEVGINCLPSNWKDSVNPLSLASYSKYTVKIKKVLNELIEAASNSLYNEFDELYDKLNGML